MTQANDNKGFVPYDQHQAPKAQLDGVVVISGNKMEELPAQDIMMMQDEALVIHEEQPLIVDHDQPKLKMPMKIIPKSPPPTPEGYTVAEHYQL